MTVKMKKKEFQKWLDQGGVRKKPKDSWSDFRPKFI